MSLTIKQAFEALSDACANGMKNPFFVMRRLKESFADVASKVVDASGDKVTVTQTLTEGTEIGSIKVNNDTTTLYAPASSGINYSTEERIIGKYIDGTTDVYEKFFDITEFTIETLLDLGIPETYTIIDGSIVAKLVGGSQMIGSYDVISYVNPGNNSAITIGINDGKYAMYTNIPAQKKPSHIFIKLIYIKPAN